MQRPPGKPSEHPRRMVDLLRARAGFETGDGTLTVAGQSFAARVADGVPDAPATPATTAAETLARFGTAQPAADGPRTPWRRSPSTLGACAALPAGALETLRLGDGVAETRSGSATARGTAWHLAFRVLAGRPDLAGRIAAATGLPDAAIAQIAAQARALTAWLADRGYDDLHFELPLQETSADGSETNAILDCLAEGPDGLLIIDHKSGPCPDPEARFAAYQPQLAAYAAMVHRRWPDKKINGLAIHWMSEGTLSLARLPVEVLA